MVAPYTVIPNRNRRSILMHPPMQPYTVRPYRVGGPDWDAQRFYFRAATAAAVSPAFDAAWTVTSAATRLSLATTRSSADTLANVLIGNADGWTVGSCLFRQYVSSRMRGGVLLTAATATCVLRAWEANAADNLFSQLGIRVCSEDGATIRATLLAVDDYRGTELSTALDSKIFANGEALGSYTTQEGDRIVVELGLIAVTGDSTPNGRMNLGSSATTDPLDYPIVESDTSTRNPWIEFTPAA